MIWRFIGVRHLTARRRQTLMAVLAVGLGVGLVLTAVYLTDGFKAEFLGAIQQTTPDVLVEEDGIRTYGIYLDQIRGVSGVTAATPFVRGGALLEYRGEETTCQVKGVMPEQEAAIFSLREDVVAGSFDSIEGSQSKIVLGDGLADDAGVGLGDTVTLSTREGSRDFTVSGIYHTGTPMDSGQAFVDLETAQDLLGTGHQAHGFDVAAADAEAASAAIEAETGLEAKTWREATEELNRVWQQYETMDQVFYVLILVIASAGISNVMLISVMSKTREIGMLKSMGATDVEIAKTFLFEGAALAGIGAVVGNALAYAMTKLLPMIVLPEPPEGLVGGISGPMRLHMEANPYDAAFVTGVAVALTLVFSVYPALKAARMEPVEALKRE